MVSLAATRDEIIFFGCSSAGRMVDESDEARRPEKILTTILHSKKDIDEHNTLRHCQDRSWYPHRVTGRGVGQRPTSVAQKRKKHTGCHVRLPVNDKSTNTMGATAVEAEGLAPFAVTYVARSLQCIGHKSDGAHSVGTKKKKAAGQAEKKNCSRRESTHGTQEQ